MRTIYALFVVSVALFVFGIGFIVAGARTLRQSAPVEAPITTPVASIQQVMNGITAPAATVVYESVGTTVSADGVQEKAPSNDGEWARVANNAAALAESGNLLMLRGRAVDSGDWMKISQELIVTATMALKAAEAKDKDGILTAGSKINETCDSCHAKYQRR